MSESMAFIGGVAVAGLAALLLLKGTNNPVPTGFMPQIQTPVVTQPYLNQPAPYGMGQPVPNPGVLPPGSDQLRVDNERMKMQLETFQRENERLKTENQQLQFQLQAFNNQQQLSAIQNQNQQQAAQLQQNQPWWSSGIVWGVGGIALTVSGGIVAAGVSALFSQKSSRPVRTVQVIHPYNGPSSPLVPTTRRSEFLPPRNEARRIETPEYDDTY
ncbi:heterocyst differentiation related protein [Calothrix sp. NIES-3974]|uniref:heterocyst differentiation related protein n=1 Tax=Calothrix sp. NIES-3974 TaxID=2005462 RepID=UPI000B5FF188|nr:heterocyst differentiation related protein [Calothrix sp. NIES-3974]BAZ03397.1 heterocyst differentiation related protein [Calothrix sp. NIES-3974]